jgi:hypothetical protein
LTVALYVDDGLVAAQTDEDLGCFITDLKSQFSVTASSCFLGLQISRLPDGSVVACQESYTKKLLQKFNMYECNKMATPIEKLNAHPESSV